MSMLRHRAARSSTVEARLLVCARSIRDVFYRDELMRLAQIDGLAVHHTFTPEPPPGLEGIRPARRRPDAHGG